MLEKYIIGGRDSTGVKTLSLHRAEQFLGPHIGLSTARNNPLTQKQG